MTNKRLGFKIFRKPELCFSFGGNPAQIQKLSLTKVGLYAAAAIFLIPLSATTARTYFDFDRDLKSPENIMNRNNTGVVFYDRRGRLLARFFEAQPKTDVELSEVPNDLQRAVIAAEDKDFFFHPGYSLPSILAALAADLRQQDFKYGGSTLTQQLVKNSLLTHERSFLRKYQEILLAAEIERRYSKNQILEMYLNSVYFGRGAYGVGAGAQKFFDKKVSDLTFAESVLLAALPVAPSRLADEKNDRELKERYAYVLSEMQKKRFITPSQKEAALRQLPRFKKSETKPYEAVHFSLMVLEDLLNKFGEENISRSGFKVYTTIDLTWQEWTQETLSDQVKKLSFRKVGNGAVVALDPHTGEVRALVGSRDWEEARFGKVNMAILPRQPGSAFKPIVYAAAFEKGLVTPASVLPDVPLAIRLADGKIYKPENYDKKFRGQVLVRRALANSLNVPSVNLLLKLGLPAALEMGKRLGLKNLGSASDYGPALVLGAAEVKLLELTEVYATLANQGVKNEPILYTKIENKYGQEIFASRSKPSRVLKAEEAFLISSILADGPARAEEFGATLNLSRPAAVKTGTTTGFRDSWTLGYTPSLAVGVWLGNNDHLAMDSVAGSLGAAPVWRSLMEKFLAGTPVENFVTPPNLSPIYICRFNGLPYRGRQFSPLVIREFFIKGTEPKGSCEPTPAPPTEAPKISG